MFDAEAVKLFERLAEATWDRICYGEELDCRQSETTITDINLLELRRARLRSVRVEKASPPKEARTGLDWEWWIGSDLFGWWRYAVQAKKLSARDSYALRHRVGGQFQLTLLEKYARANGCIPLYCFYNYVDAHDNWKYWSCNLPFDEPQLGCTVANLDIVRKCFRRGARKGFRSIHKHDGALPWRCLVRCPHILEAPSAGSHPLAANEFEKVAKYRSAPEWLFADGRVRSLSDLSPDLYSPEVEVYPARILLVDVGPEVGVRG